MASIGNMYPNLPGMLVEFKDGGQALRFNETEVTTDSLLLLGTSIDGPLMEPIAVDIDTVELLLGTDVKANGTSNGATLLHAFKQAYDAGCRDIRVMRISGEKAKASLSAPNLSLENQTRSDENLTLVQGNDITEIILKGTDITQGTVKVFAKGVELTSGVTYDSESNKVTIAKNTCDAGASLAVKYEYVNTVEAVPQMLVVGANKKITTFKTPLVDSLVIKNEQNETIEAEGYTLVGKEITFTSGAVEGDIVTVSYSYSEVTKGYENENEEGLFSSATSKQVISIANAPIANSLILYVDEARVLNTEAFEVDVEGKTISVNKEYFKMGQVLSTSYYVQSTEVVSRSIELSSIFAGEVYNTGYVEVRDIKDSADNSIGKTVIITKPESKLGTGEYAQSYSSFDYPTFGDLVDAINENNTVYNAITSCPDELTAELNVANTYFADGNNGINISKQQMFECLSGVRDVEGYIEKQGAYQLLENYQVDWVVPVGVYADDNLLDKYQNFAYELALFCAILSYKNKTTYGMIATKPLKDTSLASIQAHAKYLSSLSTDYFMRDSNGSIIKDGEGTPIDLGKFISVISGPTPKIAYSINSMREGNPAVLYAGFNTTLQPQSAPTNKKLVGCTGLKYTFSNAQLNDIVGNKIVVLANKYSANGRIYDGAYIVDAPTSARKNSEYTRLTTCKVIRVVTDNIREVADPFIGEANTIEQRNALSAAISKRLDILIEKGVLINYSFNLVATNLDQLLGQAKLELGIVAPQELRKITTVIGLK